MTWEQRMVGFVVMLPTIREDVFCFDFAAVKRILTMNNHMSVRNVFQSDYARYAMLRAMERNEGEGQ